jgi:O-acetyl-ADP-ribose deacetylase
VANRLSWRVEGLTVAIQRGDLTRQAVDAIVNAANSDLLLGGGVAGAIARAGGPSIQEECRRLAPVEVGDAAITSGGRLPARFVIHAASMRLGGLTGSEALRRSTRRSLELARDHGLRSIAFPAVGTGIAQFPVDDCARIMLDEVLAHARQPTSLQEVRFVLFAEETEGAFTREAQRRLAPAE